MLIVLPPSETKRDGGGSASLDIAGLSFARLNPVRRKLVSALVTLSRNESASLRALKLGPKGAAELARNRVLRTSPTMPAIERYTGVLYDALDVSSLDAEARARAGERVLIHSALFGLLRAEDLIPAYRFSHDSRLPELPLNARSLKALWRDRVSHEFAALTAGGAASPAGKGVSAKRAESIEQAALLEPRRLVLDLRSEGYVELGPAPGSLYLRVVTRTEGGQVRALNHFNKHAKGAFTRDLLSLKAAPGSVDELIAAAHSLGWKLSLAATSDASGELVLEL